MLNSLLTGMIQVTKKLKPFLAIFAVAFMILFAVPNVALAYNYSDDLIFFNGGDEEENIIFTYSSEKPANDNCQTSGTACYNYDNKTQSLLITGFAKPATRIKVYDDPSGSTNDDYAVIDILPDLPPQGTAISSFEQSTIQPGYRMSYVRKDGLNGNISHITIQP